MYEIMIEDRFAAAHQLLGYEGPCENIHGHTWKVQVFLKGRDLGKTGMLFDFKEAKMILKEILKDFDHKNLNEGRYFKTENPTAENIAKRIYNEYKEKLAGANRDASMAEITKTTVWESEATCATYSS